MGSEGAKLRQAVQWISDRRREDPDAKVAVLVSEAAFRFDLSPKDEMALFSILKKEG